MSKKTDHDFSKAAAVTAETVMMHLSETAYKVFVIRSSDDIEQLECQSCDAPVPLRLFDAVNSTLYKHVFACDACENTQALRAMLHPDDFDKGTSVILRALAVSVNMLKHSQGVFDNADACGLSNTVYEAILTGKKK